MRINRLFIGTTSALGAIAPAIALQFPGTCITPPATVTRIPGIDTHNARMEARYTLPDIIQACNEGYVRQGTLSIDDCIRRYRLLTDSPPLNATADCVAGSVNVEGERTTLPAHTDCATGGFRLQPLKLSARLIAARSSATIDCPQASPYVS